jgi:flavorubredoxin
MFDKSTGCLFTSESFGWRHLAAVNSPVVVTSAKNLPSVDTISRELAARMNWMREAEYKSYIDRFMSIFKDNDVQMIAPVHGCVIKGRDAVAAHVEVAAAAMTAAAKLPDTERMQYV